MLILGDTDPSLLRRSLMPGVPETAGKTVSARRSAHTNGDLGATAAPRCTVVSGVVQKNNKGFSVESGGTYVCAEGGLLGGNVVVYSTVDTLSRPNIV